MFPTIRHCDEKYTTGLQNYLCRKYNHQFTKCIFELTELDCSEINLAMTFYKPKLTAISLQFDDIFKTFVIKARTMTIITSDSWTEYYLNGSNDIQAVIRTSYDNCYMNVYCQSTYHLDKNLNLFSNRKLFSTAKSIHLFI